jgi:hypothetical protein
MRDRDRYIPTPEELEEGLLRRGERKQQKDGIAEEKPPRRRTSLLRRRKGVGKRRIYEESESRTKSLEPSAEPSKSANQTAKTVGPPDSGSTRVESVRIRTRHARPKKSEIPYAPDSPQAMFHGKAMAKGHVMSALEHIPHSTNFSAACMVCGMTGELVIQQEENYANQTYEFARGPAVERTCPSAPR